MLVSATNINFLLAKKTHINELIFNVTTYINYYLAFGSFEIQVWQKQNIFFFLIRKHKTPVSQQINF